MSKLSDEEAEVLILQGVSSMDPETLAKIIQDETGFSDQQAEFAFKQHIEGPSTVETIKNALELFKKYRPSVAETIAAKKPAKRSEKK
ncbi:hypothetical protein KAT63_02345 [Candidatus Parcubacteria bacterium]|nr:hypothetical protein [Candidatus Parcubacteria bacterium]